MPGIQATYLGMPLQLADLDHENLDVYHRSIEFLTLALRLVGRLPRGEREIRDQLKRAAMSVPLNIAEGTGKPTAPDRARFYGIARGSAMGRPSSANARCAPATETSNMKKIEARQPSRRVAAPEFRIT